MNVINANKCIDYLLHRPKTEMVGLGLIYGAPGLGKTRFGRRLSFEKGYIYYRLEATTTAKTFIVGLRKALNYKLNFPPQLHIKGSTNQILRDTIEILKEATNIVIIIDEIDYAFNEKKLLGSIRDIIDETLIVIILIGEQNSKQGLLKINQHYFDRCNYFVEFKPLKYKDVERVCNNISDIEIDIELIRYIQKGSKGNLRKIVKYLHAFESIAKEKDLKRIRREDVVI